MVEHSANICFNLKFTIHLHSTHIKDILKEINIIYLITYPHYPVLFS